MPIEKIESVLEDIRQGKMGHLLVDFQSGYTRAPYEEGKLRSTSSRWPRPTVLSRK